MDAQLQTMQGEMRRLGQWLQAGIMAALRAETNELGGRATAVSTHALHGWEPKISRKKCFQKFYENSHPLSNTCRAPKSCRETFMALAPKLEVVLCKIGVTLVIIMKLITMTIVIVLVGEGGLALMCHD